MIGTKMTGGRETQERADRIAFASSARNSIDVLDVANAGHYFAGQPTQSLSALAVKATR